MKVKKLFLFAAAAVLFAACSSDDLTQQVAEQTPQDNEGISFDAYMQRSTTRAGYKGDATTGELKNTNADALGKSGFGVFAYYTDNFDYTPLYQPNFMYNEQVTWDGSTAFKYGVTKYWPNEHGSQAQSSDMDRVSFFAYLPWVEVEPATGMLASSGTPLDASADELQWGITGMKRNTLQGDPVIQYISSFDQSKSVDLCWGTTGGTDVTWSTNGSTQPIKAGYPWLNVRKPSGVVSDDARVKFNFQHALAKLAVTVKTDFTDSWTSTATATQTRVWVRSIRFTGIAHKAALNLNNPKTLTGNKARWIDYYGTNELELGESVTVYDGRKDGSEGVADALAPNEAVLGLNPAIVQVNDLINTTPTWKTDDGLPTGVTPTPVNVFRNGTTKAASHVYVIPTGEKVNVEIVYDIETIDPKLPTTLSDGETPGSTVENRITKAVSFGASNKFENGKSYTLNLILGMKDVQFTATVNEDWESGGESNTYMPNNLPEFAASTSDSPQSAYTDGALTTYKFVVTGLDPDEDVSGTTTGTGTAIATGYTINTKADGSGTEKKANANGTAYVTATIPAVEVLDVNTVGAITVTGSASSKKVVIDLKQNHRALGLTAPSSIAPSSIAPISADGFYTYTATGIITPENWQISSTGGSGDFYVKVKKNGVDLVLTTDYTFSEGKLTLKSATVNNDVITLTVKTGDADAETVSFTVTE